MDCVEVEVWQVINKLQAEVEEYRIASLQLADNAMKFYEENQQLRNFHNEQAICAEKFVKVVAENRRLMDALEKIKAEFNGVVDISSKDIEIYFITVKALKGESDGHNKKIK